MAAQEGWAPAVAQAHENAIFRAAAYPAPPALFAVQFHGDHPGAAGTANVAQDTTRYTVTMGPAGTNGTIANSATIPIASPDFTEPYLYWSGWSSATPGAGTFLCSGVCAGLEDITAGVAQTVAIGKLTFFNGVATN